MTRNVLAALQKNGYIPIMPQQCPEWHRKAVARSKQHGNEQPVIWTGSKGGIAVVVMPNALWVRADYGDLAQANRHLRMAAGTIPVRHMTC